MSYMSVLQNSIKYIADSMFFVPSNEWLIFHRKIIKLIKRIHINFMFLRFEIQYMCIDKMKRDRRGSQDILHSRAIRMETKFSPTILTSDFM